jgi:hypothetical protein
MRTQDVVSKSRWAQHAARPASRSAAFRKQGYIKVLAALRTRDRMAALLDGRGSSKVTGESQDRALFLHFFAAHTAWFFAIR